MDAKTFLPGIALAAALAAAAGAGYAVSEHKNGHQADCAAWDVKEPYCSAFKAPVLAVDDHGPKTVINGYGQQITLPSDEDYLRNEMRSDGNEALRRAAGGH
jgi:hypothetical protein